MEMPTSMRSNLQPVPWRRRLHRTKVGHGTPQWPRSLRLRNKTAKPLNPARGQSQTSEKAIKCRPARPELRSERIFAMCDSNEITRRGFIAKAGKTLLAANVAGALLKDASAEQLYVPDPPGRKLGWAIVGLGNLSINQILPAFAKCEKSRVVAFVSGHPDKANKLALRYGVNPK